MRLFLVVFILATALSTLWGQTPFNLHGLKKLSVHVADHSDMFDETMKIELEAMMKKKLEKLHVVTNGYFYQSFVLLMKSQSVGKMKLLNMDLMITGDVRHSGDNDLRFGITYLLQDSVEVENKKQDAIESLSFLLDEFSEQYIQDNKE